MTANDTLTPRTGHVRLRLESLTGHTILVGPFGTLGGARRIAEDLISEQAVRAVRVEHRQRHRGWRPAWTFTAVLGLLLATLAGCATSGTGSGTIRPIPAEIGRRPTLAENAQIAAFAPRVIEAARAEGFTCSPVIFAVSDTIPNDALLTAARPSARTCPEFYIKVNPSFLHRDTPDELGGTLAHELGHVMNRDWHPARSQTPQITREREADAVSIRILRRISAEACLAKVVHFKRVREENIKAWGVEQRDTVGTHPSYTERIATFERDCRGVAR